MFSVRTCEAEGFVCKPLSVEQQCCLVNKTLHGELPSFAARTVAPLKDEPATY
jgi:hypothetical protein